jgi:hypothetical protein
MSKTWASVAGGVGMLERYIKPAVWNPLRIALAVSTLWEGSPWRNLEKSMSCACVRGTVICVTAVKCTHWNEKAISFYCCLLHDVVDGLVIISQTFL